MNVIFNNITKCLLIKMNNDLFFPIKKTMFISSAATTTADKLALVVTGWWQTTTA